MSVNRLSRAVAPFALAALALGMTACGSDEPESTPTVTVTSSVEDTPTTEPTMEGSQPSEETSERAASLEPTEAPVGPNDESGVVDVTTTGDEGILALQHSGFEPSIDASSAYQELIVGPGGCFALVDVSEPQLLVFPDDATFVLQEGKPSATIDGTEYLVGRQFDVDTTEVEKTNVAGIPERCEQGSASTVRIVS